MMSFAGVVEALLKVIGVGGTFMELIITPVSERKRGLKILPTDHQGLERQPKTHDLSYSPTPNFIHSSPYLRLKEGLDSLGKFFVELQVIPEPLGGTKIVTMPTFPFSFITPLEVGFSS